MEALAIVGGVVAFGQLGNAAHKLYKKAKRMLRKMKNAPEDVLALVQELQTYSETLRDIDLTMDYARRVIPFRKTELKLQLLQRGSAQDVLCAYEKVLDEMGPLLIQGQYPTAFAKLARFRSRLDWARLFKRIEAMKRLLHSKRCNINLMGTIAQLKASIRMLEIADKDPEIKSCRHLELRAAHRKLEVAKRDARQAEREYRQMLELSSKTLQDMPHVGAITTKVIKAANVQMIEVEQVLDNTASTTDRAPAPSSPETWSREAPEAIGKSVMTEDPSWGSSPRSSRGPSPGPPSSMETPPSPLAPYPRYQTHFTRSKLDLPPARNQLNGRNANGPIPHDPSHQVNRSSTDRTLTRRAQRMGREVRIRDAEGRLVDRYTED